MTGVQKGKIDWQVGPMVGIGHLVQHRNLKEEEQAATRDANVF